MARDGSGTYSLPATFATANQVAQSATVNSIMADIAQALTDSINKDGSKAFAANQSMGSNKLTNLAAATAAADAARLSQVQAGNSAQATTVGGTVDVVTLAFTPAITAYVSGMRIRWTSGGANTVTTPTINVDGLGAKTVKKNPNGAALAAGDFGASGTILEAVYNGTDFILLNPPAASPASASDTVAGLVELATTTETLTGTDATRAVTPDGLAALWEQGSDIASAGTITVGEGGYFNVTGTTTITDIDPGTDKAGRRFFLKFAGALTLTHNASTLILPGGANITTAAGDIAEFVSEGSDAVRCVGYTKASGRALVEPSGGMTLLGTIDTSSGAMGGGKSLTSLTLTNYKALRLVWNGVSINSADDLQLHDGTGAFTVFSNSGNAAHLLYGVTEIDLTTGVVTSWGLFNASGTYAVSATEAALGAAGTKRTIGRTRFTTASTAVRIQSSGTANGDAGSVAVYGVS